MSRSAISDEPAYSVSDGWPAVFGTPLFPGDRQDVASALEQLTASGRRHLVVTPNVDQLLLARERPELRTVFSRASLLLVDGAPLVGLARVLGAHVPIRYTGADLLPDAARLAAARGWTVVITGGARAVTEEAAAALRAAHATDLIHAVPFPEPGDVGDDAISRTLAAIVDLRPHVVFVCLGFPKQESWVLQRWSELPPAVYIGAGAAVDFAAGRVRRAPHWMRSAGVEWLWRLGREPRRLAHRYLVRGPRFLSVALEAARSRRS